MEKKNEPGNLAEKIAERREEINEKLRQKLNTLPPSARLNIILLVLLFYAVATIFILVGVFRNENTSTLKIKHIESAPLIDAPLKIPKKAENDTTYNYKSH